MRLTEKQIQEVKDLYGDNMDGADIALEILKKRSNVPKLFDKNGYINWTIEEFEKMIMFPKSKMRFTEDGVLVSEIINLFKSANEKIKEIHNVSSLDVVKYQLRFCENAVNRRFGKIKDRNIKLLQKEIEYLQNRLDYFEKGDSFDFTEIEFD